MNATRRSWGWISGGSSSRKTPGGALTELEPEQLVRFEKLRAWRREIAKEQTVPAYVVFSDATLRELAVDCPDTLESLTGISGIGRKKLEQYGEKVLAVLAGTGD